MHLHRQAESRSSRFFEGVLAIMGESREHRPVLLILAVFSRYPDAIQWARQTAAEKWGDVAIASEVLPFEQTTFYESEMGAGLKKQLLAFERFQSPASLAQWKHQSNQWEAEYATRGLHDESRPLNVDPGYLTEAKLVLASTKDRDHRLYLSDGIFAEVTLYYYRGAWKSRPWTYPDFQSSEYHEFFDRCRGYLRERYKRDKT